MEQGDDASLELSSLIGSNSDWWEWFPEDQFANVCSNEKRDTWSKTVAFLKKLIKHQYHESSEEKLCNNQNWIDKSKFRNWTVHAREEICKSLSKSNKESKQFWSWLVQFSVFFTLHININDFSSNQKLQDHTWSNNWWHTKFHYSTLVWGKDYS